MIAYHQGPLPPAEVFADYDRVCPGAARDILDMAKKAQAHAHEMESRALSSETRYRVLGIVTAGFVVSAIIAGAVVCAVTGHDGAAIALGAAAGLSALAGVFVRGRGLFETPPEPEAVDKPPKKPPAKRGVRRGGRNQAG